MQTFNDQFHGTAVEESGKIGKAIALVFLIQLLSFMAIFKFDNQFGSGFVSFLILFIAFIATYKLCARLYDYILMKVVLSVSLLLYGYGFSEFSLIISA